MLARLTAKVLLKTGTAELSNDPGAQKNIAENKLYQDFSGPGKEHNIKFEESVGLKRRLIKNWADMHSEQIIEELENLQEIGEGNVPKVELRNTTVLWLLKALAYEKSVLGQIDEAKKTYRKIRHLGKWKAVLVLNNLAVLTAKEQDCPATIELLIDAIKQALVAGINLKAPYYNCALVFQQLDQQGLIRESRYLEWLDYIDQLLLLATQKPDSEVLRDFEKTSARMTWKDNDIEAAYKAIAKFGYDLPPDRFKDFFRNKATNIVPDLDLFPSFGDASDQTDSQTAHEFFNLGISCADEQHWPESIDNLKLASQLDPNLSIEAEKRTKQVLEEWRINRNQEIKQLLDRKEYDKAASTLSHLPNRNLIRHSDSGLAKTIRERKHRFMLQQAEDLAAQGKRNETKLKYIELLKEEELDSQLRLHISKRLVELIK